MYNNEHMVLKKLGIPSWRHLSKDKFMDFIAVMPEMSDEVRTKIIEQLPQFTKLRIARLDSKALPVTILTLGHFSGVLVIS